MYVRFFRDDLDSDEYSETKSDTIDQLKEFSESLNSMKGGNLSLVDDLNRIQLVSCDVALAHMFCLLPQLMCVYLN